MATSKEARELPFCHPMARRPGARLAARARAAEEALVPPGGRLGDSTVACQLDAHLETLARGDFPVAYRFGGQSVNIQLQVMMLVIVLERGGRN